MTDATYGAEIEQARTHLRAGEMDQAVALADRVLARDRHDSGALCVRAAERLVRQDFDAALDWARRAEAGAPTDAWPRRLAALTLSALHRDDEARAEADIAVSLAPGEAPPLLARVQVELAAKWVTERTLTDARELVRLRPDLVESHTLLTQVLIHGREVDEAVAAAREAMRIDPDNVVAQKLSAAVDAWQTELGERGCRALADDKRTHELMPMLAKPLHRLGFGAWALVIIGALVLPGRGVDPRLSAAISCAAGVVMIGYCLGRLASYTGRRFLPIAVSLIRHERYYLWWFGCPVTAIALLGVTAGVPEQAGGYLVAVAFAVLFASGVLDWAFRPRRSLRQWWRSRREPATD